MSPTCVFLVAVVCCLITQAQPSRNVCSGQRTCGECLTAGGNCVWCRQEGYDSGKQDRCGLAANLLLSGCNETQIEHYDNEVVYEENMLPMNAENGKKAIQLSPQKMNIKLIPNKPFTFNLTYRPAENYPVDLYFVMDLSDSMKDDKKNLAVLGQALAERMREITENFRLGFGSFVDKKTMPYVSTVPEKLISPCTGCAAPYEFQNQLSLTNNTDIFAEKVENAPISGNQDSPEAGFSAIMQAIACKNDIGWRETSRKMLLFSTDAGFHTAGDGKIGGIVTPNDGECHLDAAGMYSESLNQDYPSINQMMQKVAEEKVNIIFAVTKDQINNYELVSRDFEGSVVGELATDSSNIVELVRNRYDMGEMLIGSTGIKPSLIPLHFIQTIHKHVVEISGTVEMKTVTDEDVFVTFKTNCNGQDVRDIGKCEHVGIGSSVEFEVTVQVNTCPDDISQRRKSIQIYPVGLTETLTIDLELICDCDCEEPHLAEIDSPKCNGTGNYSCGYCSCNKGRYGNTCQCDSTELNSEDHDAACRMSNNTYDDVCEGRGNCVCGVCECNPIFPGKPSRYSGTYCQCNDYNCDHYDGKLCGGPKRGKCNCGTCECNAGFTGQTCDCPTSNEACRTVNGTICSDHGICSCGVCVCDESFRGRTCEDCPTCLGKCDQHKACVQCSAFQSGELSEEHCKANCTHVAVVDSVEEEPDVTRLCTFLDVDNCIIFFTYEYEGPSVKVQSARECPRQVNPLGIIFGVIGGIIAIGLALLLFWKLFVTMHDRREYAKFENERQKATWESGENPLYKQATTTFQNPTFGAK